MESFQQPLRAPTVPPYQPGQLLPTIVTGETLKLDEYNQGQDTQDPFADAHILPHVPLPTTQPYVHYDQDFPETIMDTLPPQPSEGYHYMSQPDQNQRYQYIASEPLPAGSEGFIDHFQHDTEAYASGNSSRVSYRPPRSRSPTPAVDDEDYLIIGNDGVHYTGYPQAEMEGWDPEKAMYPHHDQGGFLNDRYADALGQDVGFDDAEKTPVSTLNYLEPDTPVETRHFGPAPTGRIHRRHKSKKRVQLTNGNLVVDISVPPNMVLPYRGVSEMATTRYTAVTCDPDDFEKNGFFLRQNESGRRTELFIVITMYNVSSTPDYLCIHLADMPPFFTGRRSLVL
jgi:chitin synthase